MGKYILLLLLGVAGFCIWRIVDTAGGPGMKKQKEPAPVKQGAAVGNYDSRVKQGVPLETPFLADEIIVLTLPLSTVTAAEILAGTAGKDISGAQVVSAVGGGAVVISGEKKAVQAAALVINGMDVKQVPTVVVIAVVLRDEKGASHRVGLWDVARKIAASSEFGNVQYDWATGVLSFGAITAAQKVIEALGAQSIGKSGFSVVDRPHLAMQSGKSAVWESGREIPVPVLNQGSVNTTTSIQYKRVITGLTVSATVNASGRIVLEVLQTDDRIIGTSRVAGSDVPTMSNQKLSTKIELTEGDVAILGGNHGTSNQKSASGFPVLGQILPFSLIFGDRSGERGEVNVSVALTAWVLPPGVRPAIVSTGEKTGKRKR